MQQNQPDSFNEALRKIQEELTVNYTHDGDLALRGLQAEAKGDRQGAVAMYSQSRHPIAIARNQLLKQFHPESITQINIHIAPNYPSSLLSYLPTMPVVNIFPVTATEKASEMAVPVTAPLPQALSQESDCPAAPTRKPKPRNDDFESFSEDDIEKCTRKMTELQKTILKKIHEEVKKNNSANTTREAFSKHYGYKLGTLKTIIGTLSKKSLLIRWPIVSSFGEKVVDALHNKKVAEVSKPVVSDEASNQPPTATKRKKYDHSDYSILDIINCIKEMGSEEETTLLNIYQNPKEKVAYSKAYGIDIETVKAISRRLSNKSLVTVWPELSKFGKQVTKILILRRDRDGPTAIVAETKTPASDMAALSPTFTPMQQLAKVCAKQLQAQKAQTTTPTISNDPKRSNIHSLLN